MLLARIAMQADGVPLFIEELTKDWIERAKDPDITLQTIGVPTTLRGSLLARLDRLPEAKQVAQVGAVIGREFSHELISEVTDLPEPVFSDGLEQLVSSGLVHRRGEPPSATYRFRHALVQRAVYSTVLRSHRQVAHGRIAMPWSGRKLLHPDPGGPVELIPDRVHIRPVHITQRDQIVVQLRHVRSAPVRSRRSLGQGAVGGDGSVQQYHRRLVHSGYTT